MSDAVAQGRAAWERLRSRDRATWEDWLAVGEALIVGRTEAMKQAKTNKPLGSRYNRIVGAWLRSNGFDGINNQERYRAILCVENRDAIEQWRATVDPAKQRRYNHPSCVWTMWSRATHGQGPTGKAGKDAEREGIIQRQSPPSASIRRRSSAPAWR